MTGRPLARIFLLPGAFLVMAPALPAAAQMRQDIQDLDPQGRRQRASLRCPRCSLVGCDDSLVEETGE